MAFEIMEHKWVRTLKCRPAYVWQATNFTWLKLDKRNPAQDMFSVPFHCEKSWCTEFYFLKEGRYCPLRYSDNKWDVLSVGNWTVFQQTCILVPALYQTTCPGFWGLRCLGSSPLDISACAFMWSMSAFGNKEVLISLPFSFFHVKKGTHVLNWRQWITVRSYRDLRKSIVSDFIKNQKLMECLLGNMSLWQWHQIRNQNPAGRVA